MRQRNERPRITGVYCQRNGVSWALGGVAIVAIVARMYRGEKDFSEVTEGVVVGMLLSNMVDALRHPLGKHT